MNAYLIQQLRESVSASAQQAQGHAHVEQGAGERTGRCGICRGWLVDHFDDENRMLSCFSAARRALLKGAWRR